jgi:excinuclease UvrABC nuclease subunit
LQKIKKSERTDLFAFLDNALESYIASTSLQEENLLSESLAQLQAKYKLAHFPYRIECIDISHLSGGWMSGGLSCMV